MSTRDDRPVPLPVLANDLLHNARAGVLSTHSSTHEGFPFGSLAPFAVAADGSPVLVMSDLAEHTKNLARDDRASLFVQDPAAHGDPQAGARIALLGRVRRSEFATLASDRARYVARVPDADDYLDKLDFHVYRLSIEHVRLVGGFGRTAWLEASSIRPEITHDPVASASADICTHMNDDHADVLGLYVAAFRNRPGITPRMVRVDAWGFDLENEAEGEAFHFDFGNKLATPDEVRRAVVQLAKDARAKLAGRS